MRCDFCNIQDDAPGAADIATWREFAPRVASARTVPTNVHAVGERRTPLGDEHEVRTPDLRADAGIVILAEDSTGACGDCVPFVMRRDAYRLARRYMAVQAATGGLGKIRALHEEILRTLDVTSPAPIEGTV